MTRALIMLAALALMVFAVFGLARPSHAGQTRCAPHADMTAGLASKFSETIVAIGLTRDGQMMEIYVSETGTWTAVFTAPNGMSCMVADGSAFERIVAKLQPQGVPG